MTVPDIQKRSVALGFRKLDTNEAKAVLKKLQEGQIGLLDYYLKYLDTRPF